MENAPNELVMFYNVENLYEPWAVSRLRDSALRNRKNRGYFQYRHKLSRLSSAIKLFGDQYGAPALIGLAEVSGSRVLQDLTEMPAFAGRYSFMHFPSADTRRMDTALLYDHGKVNIISTDLISGDPGAEPTRDILCAELLLHGISVLVAVLHLPSQRDRNKKASLRRVLLQSLKERIRQYIDGNPGGKIIVMGDFNENPDSALMDDFLSFSHNEIKIINPFTALYNKKKYSAFYRREGLLFDQIILSDNFFSSSGDAIFTEADVFASPRLAERGKKGYRPFRTFAGSRYLGGYSDHFPVWVSLRFIGSH